MFRIAGRIQTSYVSFLHVGHAVLLNYFYIPVSLLTSRSRNLKLMENLGLYQESLSLRSARNWIGRETGMSRL